MADTPEESESSLEKSEDIGSDIKKIEEQIENIEPELFDDLSEKKKRQILMFASKVTRHQGPLPDPETLLAYKNIQGDFPERIMRMAEIEGTERRALNTKMVEGPIAIKKRGQIFGFIIAVISLGISGGAAYFDKEIFASVMGVGGIATLAAVFVTGRFGGK